MSDRTLVAIAKLADQLIPDSTGAQQIIYARRLYEYAGRVFTALVPAGDLDEGDDNAEGLFAASVNDETVLVIGGSPDNPNGVTFTAGAAVKWWQAVFADGLNISRVRPTLLPGSKVLTEAGLARARLFGEASNTKFAPESYNPLNLEVIE